MRVLFIDACMRGEASRTKRLCDTFLEGLAKREDCQVETVSLKDLGLLPFDQSKVEDRDALLKKQDYQAPMFDLARQFAAADRILIGAPYWDLAFPAVLKIYIEHIFVEGITFAATEEGLKGLCRAEKCLYLQTSGGFVAEDDPGKLYLKHVLQTLGISHFCRVAADGIDIYGVDVEAAMEPAVKKLQEVAGRW